MGPVRAGEATPPKPLTGHPAAGREPRLSKDSLIDALWEDNPPETAQKALQVHVSGLHKVLGKERLVTRQPGYLLRVEEDEFDLTR